MKATSTAIAFALLLLSTTMWAQVTPPTDLNDSVPYQGDPLLFEPIITQVVPAESKTIMDCDWPTLLGMIRDLESRIAVALEEEETNADYALSEVIEDKVWRRYDCYVLRDSVISLQIQLDEALASEPLMETRSVLEVAQHWAKLRGAVIDDGNVPLDVWGFKWGTDSTLSDSLVVPFGDYANFLDTSELDTGSFMYQLGNLERYTEYFFAAFGSNEEGPGYGDTLSFRTLPDLASGLSLDTADVAQNSAELQLTIADAGGQGPDDVQFYYSAETFIASAFTGDSLPSDSDGGTSHSVVLSGLTRYTDYYFNAMVENLAGRSYASENMLFKTLPDLAVLNAPTLSNDSLFATISDNGGQTPTQHFMRISDQSDLSNSDTLTTTLTDGTLAVPLPALEFGTNYYVTAVTKNNAGFSQSDAFAFTTVPGVTTSSNVAVATDAEAELSALIAYGNASPTAVGFIWGGDADLSFPAYAAATLGADSTSTATISGLVTGQTYYYVAYATNGGGTAYGDTLSFCAGRCYDPTMGDYTYASVRIGCDCWFAENLQTQTFLTGDSIESGLLGGDWEQTTEPATSVYTEPSVEEALAKYGRVYNFHAARTDQGLCPAGWSVPTHADITSLKAAYGDTVGRAMKKSDPDWNGTNELGFNLIKTPLLYSGSFINPGVAMFWTGTGNILNTTGKNYYVDNGDFLYDTDFPASSGISIRCQADSLESAPTLISSDATAVDSAHAVLNGHLLFRGWGATYADTAALTQSGFLLARSADLSDADFLPVGVSEAGAVALEIDTLTRYTNYYFAFVAANAHGTDTSDVQTFLTLPELPSLATPTYSNDSLYAVISDNGGQPPLSTALWFSEQEDMTDSTVLASNLANDVISAAAPTLEIGTNYYVQSVAENNAGTARSSILLFSTPVTVTTNSEVSTPTDTTAEVTGTLVVNTAIPTEVGVKWGTDASLAVADTTHGVLDTTQTNPIAVNLAGLSAGTTYYYTIYATNGGGTVYGDTLSFCAGICHNPVADGHTYATIRVGCDCWFAENLRSTTFANGEAIPYTQVSTGEGEADWVNATGSGYGASIYLANSSWIFNDTTNTALNFAGEYDPLTGNLKVLPYDAYDYNAWDGTANLEYFHVYSDTPWLQPDSLQLPAGATLEEGTGTVIKISFSPALELTTSDPLNLGNFMPLGLDDDDFYEHFSGFPDAFSFNGYFGWSDGSTEFPYHNPTWDEFPATHLPGVFFRTPYWTLSNYYIVNQGRGFYYNGYSVEDPRNICPVGWHVPDSSEWHVLANQASGTTGSLALEFAGPALKSESFWNGNDNIGFNGRKAGFINAAGDITQDSEAHWWSSSWNASNDGFLSFYLTNETTDNFSLPYDPLFTQYRAPNFGQSVRCKADSTSSAPVLATHPATAIDSMAATLNGELVFGGWGLTYVDTMEVTQVGFKWSTDANLANAQDTLVAMSADSTFSIAIDGLTRYTDYYYAAIAVNGNGTGTGNIRSFKTTPEVPELEFSAFETDSNKVIFNITDFGGPEADTIPTRILWDTDPTFASAFDTSVVMSLPSANFEAKLPGLIPGADYYVRGEATNGGGTAYSDVERIATALQVETFYGVTEATDSSATLSGAVGYATDWAGPDSVGFRISTDLSFNNPWDTLVAADAVIQPDSSFALNLSFDWNEEYYFKAIGVNASGRAYGIPQYFCAGTCPESETTDTHTYGVTRIGCDCYLTENLREMTNAVGDSLPVYPLESDSERETWSNLVTSAIANGPSGDDGSGVYYSPWTASNAFYAPVQNVCPAGWHIATYRDMNDVYRNFMSVSVEQGNSNSMSMLGDEATKAFMTDVEGPLAESSWLGSNLTGFSALNAGFVSSYTGDTVRNQSARFLIDNGVERDSWMLLKDGQGTFYSMHADAGSNAQNIRCVQDRGTTFPTAFPLTPENITNNSATLVGKAVHGGWNNTSEEAELIDGGFVVSQERDAIYTWFQLHVLDPDDRGLDSLSFPELLASSPTEWEFDEAIDALDNFIPISLSDTALANVSYYPVANLTDTMSYALSGLEEGAVYYFLPIVRNERGYSYFDDFDATPRLNPIQFSASDQTAPIVKTNTIELDYGTNLKLESTLDGSLLNSGNLPLDSIGILVDTDSTLANGVYTTKYRFQDEQIEALNSFVTEEWTLRIGTSGGAINGDDLLYGTQYYYTVFAGNALGLATGDTLMAYTNIGFQPGWTDVKDDSTVVHGTLSYTAYAPTQAYIKWGLTNDVDALNNTVSVNLNGDKTFEGTIVHPEGMALGTEIYYTVSVSNDFGVFTSEMGSFCTGMCPSVTFDGHEYETVKYGCDCWFIENLRSEVFDNGDSIPSDLSAEAPAQSLNGAVETYGRLYNSYAVYDSTRSVCPAGTRVANANDWDNLRDWFGGASNSRNNLEGTGNYTSRFGLKNAGRLNSNGDAFRFNEEAHFFIFDSAKYHDATYPGTRVKYFQEFKTTFFNLLYGNMRGEALSVRCIIDSPDALPEVTTLPASEVRLDSVAVGGTYDTTGVLRDVTGAGILWSANADLSDSTVYVADSLTGAFTVGFPLTGVSEGETFYYAAYAEHAAGRAVGETKQVFPMVCESPTFDGYTYDVVVIGNQCWFAENLRSLVLANGDSLTNVSGAQAWQNADSAATTINPNAGHFENYGRLYNGYATSTPGLCPTGWKVPASTDFIALRNVASPSNISSPLNAVRPDLSGWIGTDEYGFAALPGGAIRADGLFFGAGINGYMATSTVAWIFSSGDAQLGQISLGEGFGVSVRCIREEMSAPSVVTLPGEALSPTSHRMKGGVEFDGWNDVISSGFIWSTDSTLAAPTTVTLDTTIDSFEHDASGFTLYDTVYYAAFATNGIGTGYGDTLQFVPTDCFSPTLHGYTYDVVKIGEQCWFAENLRAVQFTNGDTIQEPYLSSDPRQRIYADNPSDYGDYGRLYNWYALNDGRGLCPTGWKVPVDEEFTTLAEQLGGAALAGRELKASPTDSLSWDGTNSSGFAAVPGGWMELTPSPGGTFKQIGEFAAFWSSSPTGYHTALSRVLTTADSTFESADRLKNDGLSVRCLKKETAAPEVTTLSARVTNDGGVMNGRVDFYGWSDVVTSGFIWSTDSSLTAPSTVSLDTPSGSLKYTLEHALSGLTVGDSVYFAAFATNGIGTGYGDTLLFIPSECFPPNMDGYWYDVVEIGDQCWFAENLRTTKYANGDAIQVGLNTFTTSGAQAIYDGDSAAYYADYGRLYNAYAVSDSRGLCPTNWHEPTPEEFTTLTNYLGGSYDAASKLKASSADSPSWDGTNSSGFSAVPAGRYFISWGTDAFFNDVTSGAYFWTSDVGSYSTYRYFDGLSFAENSLGKSNSGLSVRCIKD